MTSSVMKLKQKKNYEHLNNSKAVLKYWVASQIKN